LDVMAEVDRRGSAVNLIQHVTHPLH